MKYKEYGKKLQENIEDLLQRVKNKVYRQRIYEGSGYLNLMADKDFKEKLQLGKIHGTVEEISYPIP